MWEKILAVNSFVFWPISVVFFLYAVGRLIFAWDWKLLIISFIFVGLTSIAGAVIGIISES
ncbi:MAG: hypothetical protein JWM46_839 [Candidatus Kaiserbacteria bacterium]|nr:hypothetical protein [Candidatus Kaiserbacteria bacterium]